MSKDTGKVYKHSQYQLSTPSTNSYVHLYLASKLSSYIELTITSVTSVRDKNKPIPFCVSEILPRII